MNCSPYNSLGIAWDLNPKKGMLQVDESLKSRKTEKKISTEKGMLQVVKKKKTQD